MKENKNYITLTIDTEQPIEVKDFTASLSAINNQFEKYIKNQFPEHQESAKFYITEVRKGSVIIDFLPSLLPLIEHINHVTIIDEFVTTWSSRVKRYLKQGGRDSEITKSDLSDVLDTVKIIATDTKATQTLDYISHVDGIKKTKTIMKFNTPQAKTGLTEATNHLIELDKTDNTNYERVTMFFERPSKKDTSIGKRSGEKAIIDKISPNSKPLIYASELAERKIKDELNFSEDNPFKKAFIVDVNVEIRNSRIWAYRITHVHQIIPTVE